MSLAGIIGAAVLIVIALAAIAKPYMNGRVSVQGSGEHDELVTSYERVLAMIRDLDEDYQTGKLDPESYQAERGYWTEQGIKLLQKIEPDNEAEMPVVKHSVEDVVLDDAIEQAIAAYRQAKA